MSTNNLPSNILVVDDDSTVGKTVGSGLEKYGIHLASCQDYESVLNTFSQNRFDVVIIESDFKQVPGLVLLQKLRVSSEDPEKRATGFILASGKHRKLSDELLLKELANVEIIIKPFNLIQILPVLSRAFERKRRNLLLENFRSQVMAMVNGGKANDAFETVKRNMTKLGSNGIALLAEVYLIANMPEQGLLFIETVCNKEPDNRAYQYAKGKMLLKLGRFKEAEPILERLYKDSPEHLDRINTLSETYMGMGKIDKVFEVVDVQAKFNPEVKDLKLQCMKKILAAGHIEEAQSYCKKNSSPGEIVRFFNNQGIVKSKAGDISGAILEYEQALKVFPDSEDNYRLYFNMALAQIRLKTSQSLADAAKNLKKCLELNPNFAKATEALKSLPSTISAAS